MLIIVGVTATAYAQRLGHALGKRCLDVPYGWVACATAHPLEPICKQIVQRPHNHPTSRCTCLITLQRRTNTCEACAEELAGNLTRLHRTAVTAATASRTIGRLYERG